MGENGCADGEDAPLLWTLIPSNKLQFCKFMQFVPIRSIFLFPLLKQASIADAPPAPVLVGHYSGKHFIFGAYCDSHASLYLLTARIKSFKLCMPPSFPDP
jgi:hypothetical protein